MLRLAPASAPAWTTCTWLYRDEYLLRDPNWTLGILHSSCPAQRPCPIATLSCALRVPVPHPRVLFHAECSGEGVAGETLQFTHRRVAKQHGGSRVLRPRESCSLRNPPHRGSLSGQGRPLLSPLFLLIIRWDILMGTTSSQQKDGISVGRLGPSGRRVPRMSCQDGTSRQSLTNGTHCFHLSKNPPGVEARSPAGLTGATSSVWAAAAVQ